MQLLASSGLGGESTRIGHWRIKFNVAYNIRILVVAPRDLVIIVSELSLCDVFHHAVVQLGSREKSTAAKHGFARCVQAVGVLKHGAGVVATRQWELTSWVERFWSSESSQPAGGEQLGVVLELAGGFVCFCFCFCLLVCFLFLIFSTTSLHCGEGLTNITMIICCSV